MDELLRRIEKAGISKPLDFSQLKTPTFLVQGPTKVARFWSVYEVEGERRTFRPDLSGSRSLPKTTTKLSALYPLAEYHVET